ncbi:MAG: hypothetical protein H0T92_08630 [Pyrinomonadaceae bacterium]|nr:hypothetical protein [Pyrinomonadaceae bacterium]
MTNQQITIKIRCQNLPGRVWEGRHAVRLGVQKGDGVIDDVPADEKHVTFSVPLRVERNPKTLKPNFRGPFAHGTPDERFIYLSWGERHAGVWVMFRRAKIHLNHLDWKTVEYALVTGRPVEASVSMTDEKGGPLCGSIKGSNIHWKVVASEVLP